jgi:aspartate carbamoyltransferase catalytic subunit
MRKRIHGANSKGKALDGVKVAIVGDILHSRVARSNLLLLRTLGAEIHFVAPPTLVPSNTQNMDAKFHYSLDETLRVEQPDVVMMLRIQTERMNASYFPTEREYARHWGFNAQRLSKLKESAILMHPGPMNRGLEIDATSADSKQSTVLEQVANGVSIRMAVLYTLLSGERNNNES